MWAMYMNIKISNRGVVMGVVMMIMMVQKKGYCDRLTSEQTRSIDINVRKSGVWGRLCETNQNPRGYIDLAFHARNDRRPSNFAPRRRC